MQNTRSFGADNEFTDAFWGVVFRSSNSAALTKEGASDEIPTRQSLHAPIVFNFGPFDTRRQGILVIKAKLPGNNVESDGPISREN